ncbi:MAG: alpha/beta fold hydrolase [Anaerolineae bacterium]
MTLILNPHLEGDTFFWPGNATGVLLVHGYTATTAEVRLLGQHLHDHGYTVAGPLLPGHGTTPEAMNRCHWQDWAQAVETAYQDLKARCERVWVGGESMGAILSLYLASEHPELAGILTYAPALLVPPLPVMLAHLLAPFISHIQKGKGKPTAVDDRWKGYPVNPLRSVVQLSRLQREVARRLPRIHQPLLIVQGRLDETIDPRSGDVMMRNTASTLKELYWLEDSTHCVILDQEWDKAAELTLAFMNKVQQPRVKGAL